MAKPVKITLWVAAFVVAAGVGAFVASRSNPFPPGVEDPGARPTASVTDTSSPAGPQVWHMLMRSRTEHRLHEGGTCTSNWTVRGALRSASNGALEGHGVATLVPPAGCPFATAQVQTTQIGLDIVGVLKGTKLRLSFEATETSPTGSRDLGGFVGSLGKLSPVVNVAEGRGSAEQVVTVPDGDQGAYVSDNSVQLEMQ